MFERFTNRARKVAVGAGREAHQLHHQYIGTEHILLALLDPDNGGLAYEVLRDAGLDAEACRAAITRAPESATGVLGEGDAAALQAIGIDLDAVRAKIEESFGPGALEAPDAPGSERGPLGHGQATHLPFTRRAKKVFELSLREALRLKHGHIGTEHILLGLVREGEGLAAKIITDAGVPLVSLRDQTLAALKRAA